MKKEKESWTLLWVWTAYLPVKEIKWEFYVKVSDFTKCMDGIRIEQEADRKHIEKLEEENKKLKKELELVRKNTRANVETLDNMYWELVDLKKENKELQKDLEHRDSFFSIMRDVLANETITNEELASILYCVVHEECWDYDLSEKELKIAKEFWERKYV